MRRQLADEATVCFDTAHAVGYRVTVVWAVAEHSSLGFEESAELLAPEQRAAVAPAELPAPEPLAE
jgi:hypothetical protein